MRIYVYHKSTQRWEADKLFPVFEVLDDAIKALKEYWSELNYLSNMLYNDGFDPRMDAAPYIIVDSDALSLSDNEVRDLDVVWSNYDPEWDYNTLKW